MSDNRAVNLGAFELAPQRRPVDATSYQGEVLERIQAEHLAYHARLRESGQVVTNGPVAEQPDPSVRGLTFYLTGSLEQARPHGLPDLSPPRRDDSEPARRPA